MTTITPTDTAVQSPFGDPGFDEAQLAAASSLARYSSRTLEAHRQDLRGLTAHPARPATGWCIRRADRSIATADVYAIWDDQTLVYIGMSRRVRSAARLQEARNSGTRRAGGPSKL